MKIKLSNKSLLEKLQYLSGVVPTSSPMPILDNFLFEVNKNQLTITASDLDNTMVAVMEVTSEDVGSVAIPSKMLIEILKALPEQPIELNVMPKNVIEIVSVLGNYNISYFDGKEFPKAVKLDNPSSASIPSKVLLTAINKTLFAVGNDDLRPVMSGVFFRLATTGMICVSTDANRLSKYSRTDIKSAIDSDFIVPKKPLSILKDILSSIDSDVTIEHNVNNVSFSFGAYQLKSRLIDAKYPNYEAVIPKENPNTMEISRTEFLSSLKRVSIFSNRNTHQVALSKKGNMVELVGEDLDYSTNGKETIECVGNGADIRIGFNARFLSEALSNLTSDKVIIEMSEPNRAGILKQIGSLSENEEILIVVMPVMLAS